MQRLGGGGGQGWLWFLELHGVQPALPCDPRHHSLHFPLVAWLLCLVSVPTFIADLKAEIEVGAVSWERELSVSPFV